MFILMVSIRVYCVPKVTTLGKERKRASGQSTQQKMKLGIGLSRYWGRDVIISTRARRWVVGAAAGSVLPSVLSY